MSEEGEGRALGLPGGAGAVDVGALESVTRDLHQAEQELPARVVLGRVTEHLNHLTRILNESLAPTARRRLLVTAGDTAVLAGWMAHDLRDSEAASEFYSTADDTAREADDPALRACIMTYLSYDVPEARRARSLLQEARALVGTETHSAAAAWIELRIAEESAALGESSAARRGLARAVDVFDRSRPDEERPWAGFLDRSRVAVFATHTYARLGRPDLAEREVPEVLAAIGDSAAKIRTVAMVALADVRIQQGDRVGIELAQQALDLAVEAGNKFALDRLYELAPRLRRWRDDAVARELRDRIRDAADPQTDLDAAKG